MVGQGYTVIRSGKAGAVGRVRPEAGLLLLWKDELEDLWCAVSLFKLDSGTSVHTWKAASQGRRAYTLLEPCTPPLSCEVTG